jgi:hypothetical protein
VSAIASRFAIALVVAMHVAGVAAAKDRETRSSIEDSKPPSVALVGYELKTNILFLRSSASESGDWGDHPRIMLELSNRADHPLWAVVRLSAPLADRPCEQRLSFERRERTRTLCTQDSIVAGADYTVGITVFADSAFADTVETTAWHLQLAKSEVEEWELKRRIERENPTPVVPSQPAEPVAPPEPVSHAALHLAIREVGISFGNAPTVHGLRFNWRDRELRRVDGLDVTAIGNENPGSAIHGIGVLLYSDFANIWVDELDGLGVSPTWLGVKRSRGVLIGASMATTGDAVGIQFGGLGLVAAEARGIQLGGLLVYGGSMYGLTATGLFAWAENGSMAGINVGGLGVRATKIWGVNVGGLGVRGDESVTGISVAGLIVGAGDRLTGIAVAPLATTGDLTGLSVAGYHKITGTQRGVTIGLVNDARELRGLQIGVVNTARNNRGALRTLPLVNLHFGG